jgi:signal transduction histidine kinase
MRRVSRDHVVVIALLSLAFVVDLLVLPGGLPLAAIYGVPMLVAAQRLPPRTVLVATAAGLVLYGLNLAADGVSLAIGLLLWSSLGAIAYLSYLSAERLHEAEAARRSLQDFVGMVAHDLRGPLTDRKSVV